MRDALLARDILAGTSADPHVLRYTLPSGEKTWLFISTDDAGQDEFFIRQAGGLVCW